MNIESPAALRFLMQDDIFLLKHDKAISALKTRPSIEPAPDVQSAPEQVVQASVVPQTPVIEPVAPPTPATSELVKPTPVVPAPVRETKPAGLNYLGGNKKQILILTHYTDQQVIASEHLAALENILKRKDVAIDDVTIFNMAGQSEVSMAVLKAQFKPVKLLVLGAQAMPAGLNLPFNQLKQGSASAALLSFSFDDMMGSNDNKKAFWEQMKNL